jgi:hypothetical protein
MRRSVGVKSPRRQLLFGQTDGAATPIDEKFCQSKSIVASDAAFAAAIAPRRVQSFAAVQVETVASSVRSTVKTAATADGEFCANVALDLAPYIIH